MKIQGLAIIFIIIILPITITIGEYAGNQIEISRREQTYDTRLIDATYDALKAFQINTFNDATSDIADSKINSIEASVNAFYNSMEAKFGLQGYSIEDIKRYVPALVYTMYDGYYIYSPYYNIAEIGEDENGESTGLSINLDTDNVEYGFKPYVYYSCRYVKNDIDVVINYSLDNYIAVKGTIGGEGVYEAGYLVTIATSLTDEGLYYKEDTGEYYYSGQKIIPEANLDTYTQDDLDNYLISSQTDMLVEKDETGSYSQKAYKYVKLNGTKYYWDEDDEYIFYLSGGSRIKQAVKSSNEELYQSYVKQIQVNTSGISYYASAYKFTKWVNDNLYSLETGDAVTGVQNSGSGKIFKNEQIEYSGSNFNLHRKEVIRYSIETNLSVAIANFNNYTSAGANFQMPKLSETDWEMLENEISIISFLQGINMGGKIYNGYTVVTNDSTEEVVKEERIYITTSDGYYHKINDTHFSSSGYDDGDTLSGVLDSDFEIRKDGATSLQYMYRRQLGCYTSIVGQENVDTSYDSIYEYLEETDIDDSIKQIYYIALGRERWGTYKIENPTSISKIIGNMGDGEPSEEVPDTEIVEPEITINPNPTWYEPNMPYISDSGTLTLKAIVTASCENAMDSAKYVFSDSATPPEDGWQSLDMNEDGTYAIKEVSTEITSEGTYYLYVRAKCGIAEKTMSHKYEIYRDNNAPTITIEDTDGVTDGKYTIEEGYTNVIIAKTIYAVDESTSSDMISGLKEGSGSYEIVDPDGNIYNLTDGDGNILANTGLTFTQENSLQIGISATKAGTWTLTVSIEDKAGNRVSKIEQYYVEKEEAATCVIEIEDTDGRTEYKTLGATTQFTLTKTINVTASKGVNKIEYAFSSTVGVSSNITSWNTIAGNGQINVSSKVTGSVWAGDTSRPRIYLHVRVTDMNGNVTYRTPVKSWYSGKQNISEY